MRSHVRLSAHVKIPSTSEKSPVPTSLSTMQSHMQNGDFVVANAALVTINIYFHNAALFRFALNETFDIHQQQETLYFGYTCNENSVIICVRNCECYSQCQLDVLSQ